VGGYADQLLRVKANPYDPSNRRISILVKNQQGEPAALKGSEPATDQPETHAGQVEKEDIAETGGQNQTSQSTSDTNGKQARLVSGLNRWMMRFKSTFPKMDKSKLN